MKKRVLAAMLTAMTALSVCGMSALADDNELVLFTWENMFPQEVLDGFEEETGVKVVYSNFDTDETMLEKLSQAKGGDYDVVVADDYIIEQAVNEGLVSVLFSSRTSTIRRADSADIIIMTNTIDSIISDIRICIE